MYFNGTAVPFSATRWHQKPPRCVRFEAPSSRRPTASFVRWQFPARRCCRPPHCELRRQPAEIVGIEVLAMPRTGPELWFSPRFPPPHGRVNVTGGHRWVCRLLGGERRGRSCVFRRLFGGFFFLVFFFTQWLLPKSEPGYVSLSAETSRRTPLKMPTSLQSRRSVKQYRPG